MFLLVGFCEDSRLLTILYLVKNIIKTIFVIVPIVLIIMLMIDGIKAISSRDDNKINEIKRVAIKRIIIAVVIFFVPAIVSLLMSLFSFNSYVDCLNSATTENIKIYK